MYSYPPICRLYCPRSSTSNFFLDSCAVSVVIADVHASVQLSQKFKNPSNTESLDAVYTFGLWADVAVCGFEMIRADGTKVEAVVKEKEEAKKEFQEAVKQGYTASLGSEETKDVFSISVGNISPSEVVTINLRYLQTLKDDGKRDQVRFTFPRTYAQRYGHAPTRNAQVASTAQQQFVLEAVIQQSGSIKSVSCPSGHPMDLELGKPSGLVVEESSSDSNFAKVTLRDASGFLTQDIILVITATGLDSPRCFTEAHPSPEHDTVAMGLTFVPRFKLPDVPNGMEYIFLVDRSGSMGGARIKLVQEALVILLRGLPTTGTTFNIFSFGNNVTKFWESSQAYTQSNLDAATKHVDSMAANYGGTEIAAALSSVYSSLPEPLARPVSVFLLTDGSAWDISTCVQHTRNALSSLSTPENFIRVFTLGIGDGASTNTCDSIAMAGQGFSIYVAANESVVGKCARLVRAARTPPIRDLELLWTGKNVTSEGDDDFEIIEDDAVTLSDAKKPTDSKTPTSLSLFDDSGDAMDADEVGPPPKPKVTLPSPPRIQQAPLDIRNISPGTRSQMYAIISGKQTSIPSSIKVRGTIAGTTVELDIPVTRMLRPQNHTILHTIAAKALITDRENDKHNFPQSISSSFVNNDELRSAYLEKDIVRLGTTYGLTSRHTSFVAVDRRTGESQPQSEKRESSENSGEAVFRGRVASFADTQYLAGGPGTERAKMAFRRTRMAHSGSASPHLDDGSRAQVSPHLRLRSAVSTPQQYQPTPTPPTPPTPTQAAPYGHSSLPPPTTAVRRSCMDEPGSAQVFLASLGGGGAVYHPTPPTLAAPYGHSSLPPHVPSPTPYALLSSSSPSASARSSGTASSLSPPTMTEGERLTAVARLQHFDGGFGLTQDLLRLLKFELAVFKQKWVDESQDVDVVATALALSWLEKNGGDESLDLQEKALQWLVDQLGGEDKVTAAKEKALKLFPL